MQPLEVVLFGGFALRRGEDTVPPIPSRVGRSLFAYLVVNRGMPQARERLVTELWPNLPEARGRRRLSHTLWQLQDALGELPGGTSYLEVSSDSLAFGTAAPVRVDVEEFERGLEELRHLRVDGTVHARDLARFEHAVDLYRGEFLDGHYEPWVRAEQERLGQRYLEALSLLVAFAKRQAAYEDALVYARRLTNRDPLREDGHREVMRLSMLLGRPGEAIKQYERCVEVLADEVGTDPSSATTQLHERIVRQQRLEPATAGSAPQPQRFPDRTPLVGRDRERTAALGVLESGLGGRGGAILVEGDPGVGKTRLLSELIDDAGWRGYAVLSATCAGPESTGPFGAVQTLLIEALTPLRVEQLRHRVEPVWLAQAARLVPVLSRALPQQPPGQDLHRVEGAQRMRDALVRVLLALSEVDPALAVVDDVQWADEESLEVLAAVAAELPHHGFVLVLGYRADEARSRTAVWEAVQRIDRRIRPERLLLQPLDPFSIGELARVVVRGHRIDPAAISRLQRETGGNPLFVVETLRELVQERELAGLESDDPAQLPLPGSIRELVWSRLDRLPAGVRSVLEAAAVAGDRTDLDTLANAVDQPHASVVDAVDLLVRRSLVREVDGAYAMHHDQVRRASLEAIGDGTERALHLRLGDALEEYHPEQVERLAHHFEAAGAHRRAVGYLRAAARNAVALHAYATADGFYRRACAQQSATPTSISSRFDLLAEHEPVLDVLGERERQREVIDELAKLADADPHRDAEVARRRAMLEAELGGLATAIELADHAVDAAQDLDDPGLYGRALQAAASVRTWMGHREDAVPLWQAAIAAAATPTDAAGSRTMLASVLRELHRYDEAVEHLTAALRVAEDADDLREQARALGVLGSVRMEAGDGQQAIALYRRSLRTCETIGFRRGEYINLANLANVLYGRNDVAGALDAYRRAEEICGSLGDQRGVALVRMNRGFVRHASLGDDAGAVQDIRAALDYLEEAGDRRLEAVCRDTLAAVALRQGEDTRAEQELVRAFAAIEGLEAARPEVQLRQRRAALALGRGRYEDAMGDLERARQMAVRHRLTGLIPGVLAAIGGVHLAQGNDREAVRATAAAVEAIGDGVECAYLIRLAHHDALVAVGQRDAATEQVVTGAAEVKRLLDALDEPLRTQAARLEPHARLLAAAGEVTPRTITVRVAAREAPTGRPLAAADRVEVSLEFPQRDAPEDPVEHRRWMLRHAIEQIAAQQGSPTVADLAAILEVSEATVRRDLAALRQQGTRVATRGTRAG